MNDLRRKAEAAVLAVHIERELRARTGDVVTLGSLRADNAALRDAVEQLRAERGELVAKVDQLRCEIRSLHELFNRPAVLAEDRDAEGASR